MYLICSITGEKCYCSDERFKALVAKAGSEGKVKEGYIARDTKTLLKARVYTLDRLKKMSKQERKDAAKAFRSGKKEKRTQRAVKRERKKEIKKQMSTGVLFRKPEGPKPMSAEQMRDMTTPGKGDQCLRPDIFCRRNGQRSCGSSKSNLILDHKKKDYKMCPYYMRDGERFCRQPDARLIEDPKPKKRKKQQKDVEVPNKEDTIIE